MNDLEEDEQLGRVGGRKGFVLLSPLFLKGLLYFAV